ncbi:MAG TPA: universal stress protein [Chloroflexota bacterium]|nr:universal stress protein [Chloroflexota bacterium]
MEKILVPTDRSAESEKALAIAEVVARAQDAQLVLVRVLEPATAALPADDTAVDPRIFDEFAEAIERELRADLSRFEDDVRPRWPKVRSELLKGPVSAALLDYEAQERPDLVVMATHGRTGIVRFALGSVTDRLIRDGTAPVLVIRRASTSATDLARALLMLDGSSVAEEAIPVTEALAGRPVTSLTLFRAVAAPDARAAAMTYLEGVKARLNVPGVSVQLAVEVGEPRAVIQRAAGEADLVILCTHGRSGFDRLRHGSVAEHVMRELDKPALLVRARRTG